MEACDYPRLCAHRGLCTQAPENTLPAFEAALAWGAKDIEMDVWMAKDGTLFVCHDPTVDRTTDGVGWIADMTYGELRALSAGCRFHPRFAGVRLPVLQEVLELTGPQVLINLHIKSPHLSQQGMCPAFQARAQQFGADYINHRADYLPLREGSEEIFVDRERRPIVPFPPQDFEKILKTLQACHCLDRVYITGEADVLVTARQMAPQLPRNCLEGHMNYTLVDHALTYGCQRVQVCKAFLTQAMLDKALANHLHVNLFWSDEPQEGTAYLALGVHTLLTNRFDVMSQSL